jgi:hypothetical protein
MAGKRASPCHEHCASCAKSRGLVYSALRDTTVRAILAYAHRAIHRIEVQRMGCEYVPYELIGNVLLALAWQFAATGEKNSRTLSMSDVIV